MSASANEKKIDGKTRDELAWTYLSQMFTKWLSAKSADMPECYQDPFTISFEWILMFPQAKREYDNFIRTGGQGGTISSDAAMQLLVERLIEKGILPSKEKTVNFNFVDGDATDWEKSYFNFVAVDRYPWKDGLFIALAAFTMKSLAGGYVDNLGDGHYKLFVTKVGIYAKDIFNFSDDGFLGNQLGFWSCKQKQGGYAVRHFPPNEYIWLNNHDFIEYRGKTEKGGDFLIFSNIHMIENFEGMSYEFSL